jgi:Flp pilus assembly protein TadD
MKQALARHRAGEFAQAEAMYREVARQVAGHPEVHHLLGLVLQQQGRSGEARFEFQAAIRAFEGAPHYHDALGTVLLASGDRDDAIACHQRAVALDGTHLPALTNLGLALHAAGRFRESADAFERVLALRPELAQGHGNLGIAQQSLGDLPAALASFRRACELAPQHAQAWNNLGAALHLSGDLDGAADAFERALAQDPRLARAHYNLSRLQFTRDALAAAQASARRAVELDPDEAEHHVQLALVLRAEGLLDESMAVLRNALQRSPRHPIAHNDLGVTLLMHGQFEQAEEHLLAAVDSAPQLTIAYENLARARRYGPGDAALMRQLERLRAQQPGVGELGGMHLDFALGKMWDDRDEPERAFPHLQAANRAVRVRNPWDAHARSDHVERLMQVFDRGWFERHGAPDGDPSAAPVLIVGMPRSGTTLVEQILASHPQVLGRGESDFFQNLAQVMPARLGLAGQGYPECARALVAGDLQAIARSYLAQLFADPGEALRFTDKNPLNFDHLGIAAVMFPNARIVHVTRQPLDTFVSMYMTHFARDNAFAYDFDDMAAFYRDYRRLMQHWQACLGTRIHEVAYEELVAQQEATSRALVAYCGLEWDPACLDFHRTRRVVGTASHWQVRQRLYAGAVGRWRRYAPWLEGLRAEFET